MNKRQIKKFTNQGLLKFKTLHKDETCLIKFDPNKISPQTMEQFVKIWKERGFNNFQVVPFNIKTVASKIGAIEYMEKQIEKLKKEISNEQ